MKINFEKTDDLNAVLELKLERADYEQEYLEALKEYRGKAQLKGFRKGKAPMSFIKKMYGKSVLAEKVNHKIQEGLFNYLKEEEIDILGDPLPNADQELIDFDQDSIEDFTFKFDLGLSPSLDIKGISESDSYDKATVDVSDDMIDEEIRAYRKRLGSMIEVDAAIEENDLITLQAEELENGKLKKDGWACEFSVSVDMMDEAYAKAVLGKEKGSSFDFDIYKLEKEKTEDYVKKYLIQNEDEDLEIGNMFKAKVSVIKRLELAEMNQEFFDKLFGKDEISSEEALREKVKTNIQAFYDKQTSSLMYREIMDTLVKENMTELPENFLKRWLVETNKEHSQEQIDTDFPKFKENLIWTMIKNKLSKKFKVVVDPEEVKNQLAQRVQGYFGGNMSAQDPYFAQIMNQMMQDRQQVQAVYSELEAEKIFAKLEKEIKVKEKKVSLDEYKEMVEAANKQYKE